MKKTICDNVPHDVGFTAKFNLTLKLIGDYISREFGKRYSIRDVSKLMHRKDLSYTKPTYTFIAKVKQRIIKTTGKHRGVKLLATLYYAEGKIVWKEEEQYNVEAFLAFLEQILDTYPTGKIVVVLDNAHIHNATIVSNFLQENKNRLELVFLPPFTSRLSRIPSRIRS